MLQIISLFIALYTYISTPKLQYSVEKTGKASTYGWGESLAEKTACGYYFDPEVIAIALPEVLDNHELCGKNAEITYRDTTITALIWDGGPKKSLGRVADLTKAAAVAIGINNPTVFTINIKY